VREALFGLQLARAQGSSWAVYGEGGGGGALFGPRSLSEAQEAVARVLGPLRDYDAAHRMELVASLRAFLEHNRSWQRTAAALGVHKQTLVYRIRRVEQLTGRRLDRTGDVAELWYALQADRVVDASRGGEGDGQARRSRSAASVLQKASSP
jgi:purine catabolism regulator